MKVYVMSMSELMYNDEKLLVANDRYVMEVFKDPNDAIREAIAKGYEDFGHDWFEDAWYSTQRVEMIGGCELKTVIEIKGYELQ